MRVVESCSSECIASATGQPSFGLCRNFPSLSVVSVTLKEAVPTKASQSPKKTSKKAKEAEDEALLKARTQSYHVDVPTGTLLLCGLVTSLLPAYVANAYFDLSWTAVLNLPVFAAVTGGTAFMLSQAYEVMFKTEFLKRQRHYGETKTEADAALLRNLRGQTALGYTLFIVNVVFVVVASLLQLYIFRQMEARANYFLSPIITAAFLWFLALKNEDARQRKPNRH